MGDHGSGLHECGDACNWICLFVEAVSIGLLQERVVSVWVMGLLN